MNLLIWIIAGWIIATLVMLAFSGGAILIFRLDYENFVWKIFLGAWISLCGCALVLLVGFVFALAMALTEHLR